MGGGTAKLLFVIEPSKPLKFGLRKADDPIFNQLHRCTRVRTDQDQHKSSVCIQPLLKGIDDRGTRGAWRQVLEPKLRERGLGVSYNRSESGKSNERSTYSPRRILRSKEQSKGR